MGEGEVAAHRAGGGDDREPVAAPVEPCERPLGAGRSVRGGPELERPPHDVGAVAALQPDASAKTGQRVDDQAEARAHSSSAATSSTARRAIAIIASSSSSVTTSGGENAIVSELGSALVISP